ncbi:MAG: LysM peptidoglycan-binding domain-containing protein [Muribaculaceae bacterium]|nr:LysM peptidoglycan-binding domain-containing protein [Muribaculaceae bacterium]
MQSFSFKSNFDENENVEKLIKERNRKIARQQIIFAIILLIVIGLLVWYFVRKTIYTEFDGYVHTQYKDYRASEDIYLFDQYAEEGDIVVPGDTLYSYTYMNIFNLGSVGSQPDIIVNDRNMRIQRDNAYAEANVLRVRIAELEAQIEREDNNIRFGMTDNSHKMDLERQLNIAKAELAATLNKAYRYGALHNQNKDIIAGGAQYGIDFSNEQWGLDHSLRQLYEADVPIIRYAVAQDTAIVTKIWAPPFSRVFKKEHILQLEDLSYDKSNVQVIAWVPTQDMGKINNNTRAEVIVNDDVSFMATVQLLGARTEDLPEELRNNLSHTYTAVMVVFRPDRDQELPLWAIVDRVPVRVRVKNYENGQRNDGSDYWYIDNDGLTDTSKEFFGLKRSREHGRYRYNPLESHDINTVPVPQETQKKEAKENDKEKVKETEAADPAPADSSGKIMKPVQKNKGVAYKLHTIVEGETLYGLAKKYNVSIEQIKELNPGIEEKFYVNKNVKIPVSQ